MLRRVLVVAAMVGLLTVSCRGGTEEGELTGSAVLAITQAPAGVACVRVTVAGYRTVQRTFPVMVGQATTFNLNGLPVGNVTFVGEAFEIACDMVMPAPVAAWLSEPVAATLVSGMSTAVTVTMRRNGTAVTAVDFEEAPDGGAGGGSDAGVMCGAGLVNCAGSCVDPGTNSSHCGACGVVCPVANTCVAGTCMATCVPEVCDGIDNDCDGITDEDLGTTTCGIGACLRTSATCFGGVEQTCVPGSPLPEVCDAIDNDCDGVVDEGC